MPPCELARWRNDVQNIPFLAVKVTGLCTTGEKIMLMCNWCRREAISARIRKWIGQAFLMGIAKNDCLCGRLVMVYKCSQREINSCWRMGICPGCVNVNSPLSTISWCFLVVMCCHSILCVCWSLFTIVVTTSYGTFRVAWLHIDQSSLPFNLFKEESQTTLHWQTRSWYMYVASKSNKGFSANTVNVPLRFSHQCSVL